MLRAQGIDHDLDGYSWPVDCNDFDRSIHPGSIESCNGFDDDCNGLIDDSDSCHTMCDLPGRIGIGTTVNASSQEGVDSPSMAWTGAEFGIVWVDQNDSQVYFARATATGVLVSEAIPLSSAPLGAGVPEIFWTGQEFAVTWTDYSSNGIHVAFTRIDPAGNVTGPPTLTSLVDFGELSVAFNGNEFAIVRSSGGSLWFSRLSYDGTPAGDETQILSDGAQRYSPRLVWSGNGYGVVSALAQGSLPAIELLVLSEDGALIQPPKIIQDSASDATQYPAITWTGSEYGIAWQGRLNATGTGVLFRRVMPDGSPLGEVALVSTEAQYAYPTQVTWNGSMYAITSVQSRNVDEAYASWLDHDGNAIAGDTHISDMRFGSRSPVIVWTGHEFAVTEIDQTIDSGNRVSLIRIGCSCPDDDHDGVTACSDCNDHDASMYPGKPEQCDLIDNDCDGVVDNLGQDAQECTVGFGECQVTGHRSCSATGEEVCDVQPLSPTAEVCDGLDNNCDGQTDEGLIMPIECDSGVVASECIDGGWTGCPVVAACDCTVGAGQEYPTLCEAAAHNCLTMCLAPGLYSTAGECTLPHRITLQSIEGPDSTAYVGDLQIQQVTINGLTIYGNVGGHSVNLFANRIYGAVSADGLIEGMAVTKNTIYGSVTVSVDVSVVGNTIVNGGVHASGDSGVDVFDNQISGGDVGIDSSASPIRIRGNTISGVNIGIRARPLSRGLHLDVSGNTIDDVGTGIALSASYIANRLQVAKNTIEHARDLGIQYSADGYSPTVQIVGNLVSMVSSEGNSIGIDVAGSGRISGNTVVGARNGVIVEDGFDSPYVTTTIDLESNLVAFNTSVAVANRESYNSVFTRRNDVYGSTENWGGSLPPFALGANISMNPMFHAGGSPEGSLDPGSPCVDRGVDSGGATDLSGGPRRLDGDMDGQATQDIGAYEVAPEVLDLNVQLTPVRLTWPPNPYATSGFDVYREQASNLTPSGTEGMEQRACSLLATELNIEGEEPPINDGYVYLVAPRGSARGSLGSDSVGQERHIADLCP
jgi:hypothetical protein